jgi:hypothetical protein
MTRLRARHGGWGSGNTPWSSPSAQSRGCRRRIPSPRESRLHPSLVFHGHRSSDTGHANRSPAGSSVGRETGIGVDPDVSSSWPMTDPDGFFVRPTPLRHQDMREAVSRFSGNGLR